MNIFTIGQFSKRVGVSVVTLQRWDREGILKANRTPTNRRFYTDEHIKIVLGLKDKPRRKVAYLRVSSQAQKPDLENQKSSLVNYCESNGLVIEQWIEEIGGGLNFKRPKFLKLVTDILNGEIETLVIAHKDRLTRFGFDLLEYICNLNGCTLIVLHNEKLSPEREMVQDLMTIIHCFSSRLYGLRHYRKSLQQALNAESAQDSPESDS